VTEVDQAEQQRRALVSAGLLGAALRDIKSAETLVETRDPDRAFTAAYLVQQAAEKIAKALLAHAGRLVTKEHRLAFNIQSLVDDPQRDALKQFTRYDAYATTARYPYPNGDLFPAPNIDELKVDVAALRGRYQSTIARLELPDPPAHARGERSRQG
jgi:HEPN domain-containing protein